MTDLMEAHTSTQCTATSKQSGKQCQKRAIRGAVVCGTHGGAAPQVRAKATERVVKAEAIATAQRMVERDGVDVDPIDHLLDSLHLSATLVRVYGSMVAELDDLSEETAVLKGTRGEAYTDFLLTVNNKGDTQLHPYMQAYEEAINRRAKIAKLCIDAGIAEMQLELIQQQVDIAQQALEATLNTLDLSKEQRGEAKRQYAYHLRTYTPA